MKKIIIYDGKFVFGFIEEYPFICSQANSEREVNINLDNYFMSYINK